MYRIRKITIKYSRFFARVDIKKTPRHLNLIFPFISVAKPQRNCRLGSHFGSHESALAVTCGATLLRCNRNGCLVILNKQYYRQIYVCILYIHALN